jgi:hypothetical protein
LISRDVSFRKIVWLEWSLVFFFFPQGRVYLFVCRMWVCRVQSFFPLSLLWIQRSWIPDFHRPARFLSEYGCFLDKVRNTIIFVNDFLAQPSFWTGLEFSSTKCRVFFGKC